METTDALFGLSDELPTAGKLAGYAKIPLSSNTSAYGFIPIPIAVIAGGDGPTALILAGSHGDEFESQIAVARVARALDPSSMNGRVIIVPMVNEPAVRAGTRNSPVDGLNLSRAYPGDVRGTPTRVIADYVERQLMKVSDIVLDLHSDGRSIRYTPCATIIHHGDPDVRADRLALALAFGAPSVLVFQSFEERNSSGAAHRAGAVRIATEIGGDRPVEMTFAGVMNVLQWMGITKGMGNRGVPQRPTVRVVRQDSDFIYALADGLFEPRVDLGDTVTPGDTAGFIHDPSRPLEEPFEVRVSTQPGTVVCTRGAGPTARGDCLMHLARPPDGELADEIEAAVAVRWPAGRRKTHLPAAIGHSIDARPPATKKASRRSLNSRRKRSARKSST